MTWVGVWIEPDDDLRFFDGVILAVVKWISEVLQEVKRSFIASGVAGVSNNCKDAFVRACGTDRDKIADPYAALSCCISANDVINVAGVDIAPRVPFILISKVSERSLRNVVAREWIIVSLQDWSIVFVDQITDDALVCAIEVMGIYQEVERLFACWAIRIRSSVDIDIHAVGQKLERRMLPPILSRRNDRCDENKSEGECGTYASPIPQLCYLRFANGSGRKRAICRMPHPFAHNLQCCRCNRNPVS